MSDFFKRIISAITSFFMTIAAFFGLSQPAPESPYGQWLLENVPAYEAGQYVETLYDTGTGYEFEVGRTPKHPSRMQLIRETTLQDAQNYETRLQSNGYRKTFSNTIGDLYCFALQKGDSGVYCIYDGKTNLTRVIDDCCNTASLDAFGYTESTPPEPVTEPTEPIEPIETEPFDPQETLVNEDNAPTEQSPSSTEPTEPTETVPTTEPYIAPADFVLHPGVYQFSFPYYDDNHKDSKIYAKNGMLYVIVLSDGKLVIIDGGAPYQCADQNINAFIRFVREITGKSSGTPMDIALWYGTHCHADHIDFFYKLIHYHRDEFRLERVMFNYQSNNVIAYAKRVDKFRNLLKKYYPNAKYVKCRSGYKFSFLDTQFEVLYTHEDAVDPETVTLRPTNANDCCSVLKVTLSGKTFLFLGDANTVTQGVLLKNYGKSVLHADVLQASHHMINDLTDLYPVVAPTYVMCPQSKSRTIKLYPSYYTFLKLAPAQRMYFADQGIYGFLPQENGTISVSYKWVYCVGYDGSGL